jgi:hypothetical protein
VSAIIKYEKLGKPVSLSRFEHEMARQQIRLPSMQHKGMKTAPFNAALT